MEENVERGLPPHSSPKRKRIIGNRSSWFRKIQVEIFFILEVRLSPSFLAFHGARRKEFDMLFTSLLGLKGTKTSIHW